jgi:RNA polymerase sigma factor (TIGR02999 family)
MTSPPTANSLTKLLESWHQSRDGVRSPAFGDLIDACYAQLRRMAAARVREAGALTLSPTEVLHDAILCLGESDVELKNSAHFLAMMSLKMRGLLVDHARANLRAKRGGGEWVRVTLSDVEAGNGDGSLELIAFEEALQKLDAAHPRCAQVMHLTYFAGMERDEVAKLLNISTPTVDRDLRFGRAFATEAVLTGGQSGK